MARTLSQIRASLAHSPALVEPMPASKPTSSASVDEKSYVPLFVPMGSPDGMKMNCRGSKGVPVHNVDILTRGDVMSEITDPEMRSGNFGAAYKAYIMTIFCFALMLLTWKYVSVYVAAVFAYATGYYYSERLLNNAWGINWLKGKTLVYTT